jgi:hypothetical protein
MKSFMKNHFSFQSSKSWNEIFVFVFCETIYSLFAKKLTKSAQNEHFCVNEDFRWKLILIKTSSTKFLRKVLLKFWRAEISQKGAHFRFSQTYLSSWNFLIRLFARLWYAKKESFSITFIYPELTRSLWPYCKSQVCTCSLIAAFIDLKWINGNI